MMHKINSEFNQNIITSIIFIIAMVLIRLAVQKSLNRWKFNSVEEKRKWIVQIRNVWFFLNFLGLLFIWATALKAFALSLVAVAAAIAIATKEYFLCFLGGVFKASSSAFSIGDCIAIGSHRGDVINHTLFSTTLLEVGPGTSFHQYTGKKITIPNALFLTQSIVNETDGKKFTFHTFVVTVNRQSDWNKVFDELLSAAHEVCAEYIQSAQSYFSYFARKNDLESPYVKPKVMMSFEAHDNVTFVVRIPVPAKDKEKIEQAILKKVPSLRQ